MKTYYWSVCWLDGSKFKVLPNGETGVDRVCSGKVFDFWRVHEHSAMEKSLDANKGIQTVTFLLLCYTFTGSTNTCITCIIRANAFLLLIDWNVACEMRILAIIFIYLDIWWKARGDLHTLLERWHFHLPTIGRSEWWATLWRWRLHVDRPVEQQAIATGLNNFFSTLRNFWYCSLFVALYDIRISR